jgi:hypothetical protein
MKLTVLILAAVLSQNLLAAQQVLLSPFPSTVKGISIRNTHTVARGESRILRGMRPLSPTDVKELTDKGISRVLIFRNNVQGEDTVAAEMEWLNANPKIEKVYEIPFKWKDITSFKEACEQTIQALKIFQESLSRPNAGLFVHCTVGEDRTGYLAGIYRMIFEGGTSENVFQADMCQWGYADGGSSRRGENIKPDHVVADVHKAITPVFAKMRVLILMGLITADKLDASVCAREPRVSEKTISRFRCTP